MRDIVKLIPFLILLLTWESVQQWVSFNLFLGGWWIHHFLKLMLPMSFVVYYFHHKTLCQKTPKIFKCLYGIIILGTLYGVFMSEGYKDFQGMITKLTAWTLCLGWLYFQNPSNISKVTRDWCKYSIPLFFILLAFMQGEAVGRFLAPYAFLLIFLPYLERKWRIIVLIAVALVLLFGALGARSSILRFAISIFFAIIIYFQKYIPRFAIKITLITLVVSPIVFLWLGISGQFNIFQIQEELGWNEVSVQDSFNKGEQENLTADTRTFLYIEEIQSALDNNYVLYGRSFARGYDSIVISGIDWKSGRNERWSCEVRMLNVFNYLGIIGVIIVSLVYLIAAFKAVYQSRSFTMQIIGVYVAFRWLYGWIEDFDRFDLINLYLWIPIFMCYSNRFIEMTENDFKNWARSIFKPNTRRC